MKVVLINTYDCGGAGLASIRLHEALLKEGIESTLLTLDNSTKGRVPKHVATGKYRPTIPERVIRKLTGPSQLELKNELVDRLKLPRFDIFTNPEGAFDVLKHPSVRDADLINLHWVARFLDHKKFFERCKKPVVWTFHDMNAFTGGCHYPMGCEKFRTACFECPQLAPSDECDLAKINFRVKQRALKPVWNLEVVSPSQWLADCAGQSAMFKALNRHVVHNALDIEIFRERDRKEARAHFKIPQNARVLLFVADYLDNERKGFSLFVEATRELIASHPDIICCFIGHKGGDVAKLIPGALHLGRIDEESVMAQAYAAADVFALPSVEDNLPNTMLESMCCGTPVIAFNSGGTAEIIRNGVNGLIAPAKTPESLRAALAQAFFCQWDRRAISRTAREMFEPSRQAKAYIEVYSKMLKR